MREVVKSLKTMISGENNDEIDSENKIELLKETISYSSSSDIACMYSNDSGLFVSKLIDEYNLESVDKDYKHILNQAEKFFFESYDLADSINVFMDKLIELVIKTQNEGNDFNETERFVNQYIFLSNRTTNDI